MITVENGKKNIFVSAIIAAAGSSSRMGGGDKLMLDLCGKTVLERSIEAYEKSDVIDEIVISARAGAVEEINGLVKAKNFTKVRAVCEGGATRQESVQNAVAYCSEKTDFVAIHDGARPLVTGDIIERTVKKAVECGAASCAVRVKDTIKVADGDGVILSAPDRSALRAVQTPQVFDFKIYVGALKNASPDVTDDCMIVEAAGQKVALCEGDYENIKITTPDDVIFANAILKARESK